MTSHGVTAKALISAEARPEAQECKVLDFSPFGPKPCQVYRVKFIHPVLSMRSGPSLEAQLRVGVIHIYSSYARLISLDSDRFYAYLNMNVHTPLLSF